MIFIIIIGVCLVLGYIIWQKQELKKFEVTEYRVSTTKIQKEQTLAVLADLHGYEYGENNRSLVEKVQELCPDVILIPGDLIVSKEASTFNRALRVLEQLVKIAPVYYGFGNHESRVARPKLVVSEAFESYIKKVEALGVVILRNENKRISQAAGDIWIGGVELALDYYEKGREVPMASDYIQGLMGREPKEAFQILLAHNPAYSEQYAKWGADLTFCGHNHGGLVRIPGIGSLISPQFTFFPKYNDDMYEIDGKHVIVSRGLGTHTFHVRIFNRAELLCVRVVPEK